MIWLNIKKLEKQISDDELTDKDGFNYLLANVILTIIVLSFISNYSNGWIKFITCVTSVIINVWGLRAAYNANLEIDGKDFFKRFLAFNWVIGIRVLVIAIIAIIIIGISIAIVSGGTNSNLSSNSLQGIFGIIVGSLFSIICYLLILNSFHKIKTKNK